MDYDYTIKHMPGKDMHLADALSRVSLAANDTTPEMICALELKELQQATNSDAQLSQLRDTTLQGWPEQKANCPPTITLYWDFRDGISVCDDILVKGQVIAIPKALRLK